MALTQSLFDQSLTAPASQQVKDRNLKNEVHEIKKIERAGRRAYRQAMRDGNGMAALAALEKTREMTGGSTGAGIRVAGQLERAIRQKDAAQRGQLLLGGSRGDSGDPAVQGSGAFSDSSGSSMGWRNVGGGLPAPTGQTPRTANPNSTPGAGSGNLINPERRAAAGLPAPTGSAQPPPAPNIGGSITPRQSLFDRMTLAASVGGNLDDFRQEAADLGVDDSGWQRGSERAIAAGAEMNPGASLPFGSDNPLSAGLMDRMRSFGQASATAAASIGMAPGSAATSAASTQPSPVGSSLARSLRGPFADTFRILNF